MSDKEINPISANCQNELQDLEQELANRLEAADQAYQFFNFDQCGNRVVSNFSSPELALEPEEDTPLVDSSLSNLVDWLEETGDQDFAEQEVYALIRFNNEVLTLKQSLNSLLPSISKGVLITHPTADGLQDDGSLQVAAEFVAQNPGFELVIYPYPVYHGNHPIYSQLDKVNRENYLDAFTNFGLEALMNLARKNGDLDPWLFKADADQIYDATLLSKQLQTIIANPANHFKVNYFVKLDLHYTPESDTVYYLRSKLQSSNFLVKAKYVRVGMVIEENRAKEVYFFESPETSKVSFKQSLKALGHFIKYPFIKRDTKNTFKASIASYSRSTSSAQRYAQHSMREIPANFTGMLNAIHFKYLKHVHTGNCSELPVGLEYQKFLTSKVYQELVNKCPDLAESELFNSTDLLLSYCQNMDFRRAHAFKVLRDFYAQLRLEAKDKEQAQAETNANSKAQGQTENANQGMQGKGQVENTQAPEKAYAS
ncbi:hypothetical protein CKF54_05515 [Psittacicella hinzii]|uniref:Uncharacterized protein n=1 Tax=Psittacicella hinzii TaxID=2028575 RepID=A0A3A1Y7D5_9GAMM|nr:hypothetical protein [Psittacicella hinzii]RIY32047.1 hypothetical protein CKF54_05515 [Psittacicella hinzii]